MPAKQHVQAAHRGAEPAPLGEHGDEARVRFGRFANTTQTTIIWAWRTSAAMCAPYRIDLVEGSALVSARLKFKETETNTESENSRIS